MPNSERMMQQLLLLPAGCQPWNPNMLDGTHSKFAYCSTQAVYIYEILPGSHEYKLTSINAEHTKTITSISWNRKKPNLIATSGADLKIIVWDVSKQKAIAQLRDLKSTPFCIDWVNNSDHPSITYIGTSGCLEEWNISTSKVVALKNISCGSGSKISVFRWHHTRFESVAFGLNDGTVSIFTREKGEFKKKVVKFDDEAIDDDAVVLLSWDPLSSDYLLVANKSTGIRMVDTASASVITHFHLPSRAATTATFSWVSSAPGMFLTGDRDTGTLRLWSVGQDTPLENFKIKGMGFSGIHVLINARGNQIVDENFFYGSHRRRPSQSLPTTHSVPPANVVCTFRDGGVGLFNLQQRKWLFLKDLGHIETIFDCKFKADNPKILATASFDGTVKIWSTSDLSPIKTSNGNEGVIYSISWAPQNLNCIVCGTRRKGVFIWDFNKGKVIKRYGMHGTYSVFCVAWNKRDSNRIASASEDETCAITRMDGRETLKIDHPAAVYGCDWSCGDTSLLATGCEDGIVRVWSVTASYKCVAKFSGHTAKVFHVRWHPLIPNILCSGSDDHTIRIWDTNSTAECVGLLRGHTSKVRGISWNHEIPYLLVTGSWDSTIRLWDARESEQTCLDVISDHGADVYGLDTHPSSPFMVASSSRDSTVRLWTLSPKVSTVFAKVLVGHHYDSILCTPEEGMAPGSAVRLAGKMSQQITNELRQRPNSTIGKLRWFSELFCANPALENFWDLAFFDVGVKESALSPEYKHGILHMDHLVKYKAAEAQELELSASTKSHAGNRLLESVLEKAAALHLKVGNLRKHCEILKTLGKWETALSLAAGVSLKYWKSLAEEYAEILEKSDNREYLQYRIAIGDAEKCVQDLMEAGEHVDALIISQSACEGRIAPPILKASKKRGNNDISENANGNGSGDSQMEILRNNCFDVLAHSNISGGDPLRAASYLLSKNDSTAAINVLVQGNELLLAICLGEALKLRGSVKEAAVLFSKKLAGQGNYLFAVEILRTFLRCDADIDTWTPIHATCARFAGELSERENLHEYASIPSPSEFYKDGEKYLESGELLKSMRCFLLSTHRGRAVQIGLDLLHRHISSNEWTVCDQWLVDLTASFDVSSAVLMKNGMHRQRNQLLALSAFLGGLKAIGNSFISIVTPLFEHAVAMTERVEMSDAVNFPLTSKELKKYLHSWKEYVVKFNSPVDENEVAADANPVIQKLFTIANVKSVVPSKEIVVAGSHLPSHSDSVVSALTNRKITGPKFCLEDRTTVISINEAIMWARVNEFSPTGSGQRVVPF